MARKYVPNGNSKMKIEITEKMIKAAQKVLWESGLLEWGSEGSSCEPLVIKEMLLAAEKTSESFQRILEDSYERRKS